MTEQLELTEQRLFTARGGGGSQADRILARLQTAAGAWVPMPELAAVGSGSPHGFCMVHSRVADLRKRGLTIEQRVPPGARREGASEYRLVPSGIRDQASGIVPPPPTIFPQA